MPTKRGQILFEVKASETKRGKTWKPPLARSGIRDSAPSSIWAPVLAVSIRALPMGWGLHVRDPRAGMREETGGYQERSCEDARRVTINWAPPTPHWGPPPPQHPSSSPGKQCPQTDLPPRLFLSTKRCPIVGWVAKQWEKAIRTHNIVSRSKNNGPTAIHLSN